MGVRMSMGGMGGAMGGGMGGMDGVTDPSMMGGAEQNAIQRLLAGLPPWLSAILATLAVLAVAALIGVVLGKLYASIRYPDPEKHSVLSAPVKVVFLAVLVACSVWLYVTFTKSENTLPVDGNVSSSEPGGESMMPPVDGGIPNEPNPGGKTDAPIAGGNGGATAIGGGGVAVSPARPPRRATAEVAVYSYR